MKIIWTEYLKYRSQQRGYDLSKIENIIHYSAEKYFDTTTNRMIAIGKHNKKLVMVPYEKKQENVIPITIHAITKQQINFRLNTGRFVIE